MTGGLSRAQRSCMAWLPAIVLLLTSAAAAGWIDAKPKAGNRPIAAIFPPWWSLGEAFRAARQADAYVVRTGAWSTILVVQSPNPGFSTRMYDAGAILLLDALRATASKGLLALLWVHVPLNSLVGFLLGNDWILSALLGVGLAGAATLSLRVSGNSLPRG